MNQEFYHSLPTVDAEADNIEKIVLPETSPEELTLEAARAEVSRLREQIKEERMATEGWKYRATHDILTHTLNRDGLELALENYAAKGAQVAFLFVDGTNIKAINYYRGYDAGDTAIKGLADILSRGLRDTDVVARIGGDEFLVAMDVSKQNHNSMSPTQQLGEVQMRISTQTEKYKKEHPEFSKLGFEVSVGYAIWEPGMTVEQVKREAEKVMKEHKQDQHEKIGAFRQIIED